MKQFSLEEYLKNPSRKVVTRDGESVRIICTDVKSKFSIVGIVYDKEQEMESVEIFLKNGKFLPVGDTSFDLFFATENKDKFNPNTLKPFDRVLARDEINEQWCCSFFSHIEENDSYPYICFGLSFKKCIPYNDETKHLVGTNDEAPEYYRYWEE